MTLSTWDSRRRLLTATHQMTLNRAGYTDDLALTVDKIEADVARFCRESRLTRLGKGSWTVTVRFEQDAVQDRAAA